MRRGNKDFQIDKSEIKKIVIIKKLNIFNVGQTVLILLKIWRIALGIYPRIYYLAV